MKRRQSRQLVFSIGSPELLDVENQRRDEPNAGGFLNYGSCQETFEYAPYVINGPQDQRTFHDTLVKLQEHASALSNVPWDVYRNRLSLVRSTGGEGHVTAQYLLEDPKETSKSWNSNYGTHGWHRYVGRFPPHLVRALLNHFGAGANDLVLDPFSGSGTTLVECRLLGIPALGVEICPLSALMSRVKATFPESHEGLQSTIPQMRDFYSTRWNEFVHGRDIGQIDYGEIISRPGNTVEPFANYERWLTREALLGVSIISEYAFTLKGYLRDAVVLALSAKMRSIGNVDVDVVRAEYSKEPRVNVNVLRLVTSQLTKMADSIRASARTHAEMIGCADSVRVIEEDILGAQIEEGSVSHVITSPPYGVEAISYLRTHLLSYRCLKSFLGADPYAFGAHVIGSEYLPSEGIDVSGLAVAQLSRTYRTFFENLLGTLLDKKYQVRASMMMKFFGDMHEVAVRLGKWVRVGGQVAFVIGNNKIGDTIIPTDRIIQEIFEASGFYLENVLGHKLKSNNSNSQVPWQDRIIQDEYVMLFRRG